MADRNGRCGEYEENEGLKSISGLMFLAVFSLVSVSVHSFTGSEHVFGNVQHLAVVDLEKNTHLFGVFDGEFV